jgi:hypothetical protein
MLAKKISILFMLLIINSFECFSENNQCNNSNNYTIYNDLVKFLIHEGQLIKELENTGKEYVNLFEVITKSDSVDFNATPFGVFKFKSNTCEDCGYYVLIKYKDKYSVIYQSNLNLIFNLLLQVKESDEKILNCELFDLYIKTLINTDEGINSGRIDIIQKIGNLEFQSN